MRIQIQIIVLSLLMQFVVNKAHAQQVVTPVKLNATTEIALKDMPLKLEIDVHLVPQLESQKTAPNIQAIGTLLGRDVSPQPVIRHIHVSWGKRDTFLLNKSAYADLYAPDQITLIKLTDQLVRLKIVGGDGATGYAVEIDIAPHGATQRTVRKRVSQYEETTYYKYSDRYIKATREAVINGLQ